MNARIESPLYVLGDNIDTDQIIPAHYLNLIPTIPEERAQLGRHAFSGLPSDLPAFIEPQLGRSAYRIVLAGKNFGCGSSREHAPIALGAAGVEVILAESFARIFFRNAIATGAVIPCEISGNAASGAQTGQQAIVDLARGVFELPESGRSFPVSVSAEVVEVVKSGGLFAFARSQGMIKT